VRAAVAVLAAIVALLWRRQRSLEQELLRAFRETSQAFRVRDKQFRRLVDELNGKAARWWK